MALTFSFGGNSLFCTLRLGRAGLSLGFLMLLEKERDRLLFQSPRPGNRSLHQTCRRFQNLDFRSFPYPIFFPQLHRYFDLYLPSCSCLGSIIPPPSALTRST